MSSRQPLHLGTYPLLTQNLKNSALERVEFCYEIAEKNLPRNFTRPQVSFNQRGKIAGSARLQSNQIRLNPVLLVDNTQQFLDEVIPHEICHLLVFQLYGRVKPHGAQWQTLMKELYGLTPKTRHTMDVSKVQGKTFLYQCGCGTTELSVRRHNKVTRGQQRYGCKKCGEILVYRN